MPGVWLSKPAALCLYSLRRLSAAGDWSHCRMWLRVSVLILRKALRALVTIRVSGAGPSVRSRDGRKVIPPWPSYRFHCTFSRMGRLGISTPAGTRPGSNGGEDAAGAEGAEGAAWACAGGACGGGVGDPTGLRAIFIIQKFLNGEGRRGGRFRA